LLIVEPEQMTKRQLIGFRGCAWKTATCCSNEGFVPYPRVSIFDELQGITERRQMNSPVTKLLLKRSLWASDNALNFWGECWLLSNLLISESIHPDEERIRTASSKSEAERFRCGAGTKEFR
jgi:hypothetical protein